MSKTYECNSPKQGLLHTNNNKIKALHSLEVLLFHRETNPHLLLLLVFLNFADQLELTEEEWERLFHLLVPTLTQIRQ